MGSIIATARYELKYISPLERAFRLRDRLQQFLVEDEHNNQDHGYHVNSIYYDTHDFRAYHEKLDGFERRVKVRVRYYGNTVSDNTLHTGPAFIEIKHRIKSLMYKSRLSVSSEHLKRLVAESPLRLPSDNHDQGDYTTIAAIILRQELLPVCKVSYFRSAYIARFNPGVRITFDVNLRTVGTFPSLATNFNSGDVFLPKNLCVIEIKFHSAIPLWLATIVRETGIEDRRYSKYCSAFETLYPDYAHRQVRMTQSINQD